MPVLCLLLFAALQIQTDFEDLFREAIARAEQQHGREHPETAGLRAALALHLIRAGKREAAEPWLRHALAIKEDPLWLVRLAELREQAGDSQAAVQLYRRALPLVEKSAGPASREVAAVANDLALLLKSQGDLQGASQLFHRALSIREKLDGPDHPETATLLNNLADVLQAEGGAAGAEKLYRRALQIFERRLPASHPRTAITRINLAGLLVGLRKPEEAALQFRHAIAALQDAGPDYRPDLYSALNSLAFLERERGAFDAAEPLVRQALALAEEMTGAQGAEVAKQCINLAWLLELRNEKQEAFRLYRRAKPIAERELGPDHPLVHALRQKLGQ